MAFLSRIAAGYAACTILAALVIAPSVFGQSARPSIEYQLKASLIFNFIQFVEWGPAAKPSPDFVFHLCIVGQDDFGVALNTFEQELVKGNRIEIDRTTSLAPEKLTACQVVFVSKHNSPEEVERVIKTLQGTSVLTIGEQDDFLARGGVISILLEDNKVVFDISRPAALAARLAVSAKLLRIARRVIE